MTQTISVEFDYYYSLTLQQLSALSVLANKFSMHHIRVTDDPTNVKVYVGSYGVEKYRYWIDKDGTVSLVEKDVAVDDLEANWQRIDKRDAAKVLLDTKSI